MAQGPAQAGAYVVDLDDGRVVFSDRGGIHMAPQDGWSVPFPADPGQRSALIAASSTTTGRARNAARRGSPPSA